MEPFRFQMSSTFAGCHHGRSFEVTWHRPIPRPEPLRLSSATPVKGRTHA